MDRPIVGVTMGDPWGVGPELVAEAVARPEVRRACEPLVFGDAALLARAARLRRVRLPAKLEIAQVGPLQRGAWHFGRPPADGGVLPLSYLEAAVEAARGGRIAALCTAPIQKALLVHAGFRFTGHTDYLAARLGARRALMLLAGPTLRVALATVHVPLRRVAALLSIEGISEALRLLDEGLRRHFGVRSPRIAVCGLNPHAGESGVLGSEEAEVITPAVRRARRKGIAAEGPFSADSLFARAIRTRRWDAILAMSHDQGLGPLKAVDFERAVNVTLGLPVPRTSPDHGVAYDIAGRGEADATSLIEALLLASRMARAGAPRPR